MHLPDSMKAVVFDSPGGADQLRLERVPLPVPLAGEVLVKVCGAGVNRPDVLQRQGWYPPPPGANPRLGLEFSGTVVGLGPNVSPTELNREVMGLANGGAYAEYVAVPVAQCMSIPSGVDLLHAASLPEVYLTVWQNLCLKGGLSKGQVVLVHGGSSGIGSAAIQLIKKFGATPIVTVGDVAKQQFCQALGVDRVVLYKEVPFEQKVLEWTNGRGADLILDMVAGPYLDKDLSCLAVGGKVLVIALLGGRESKVDGGKLLFKQASVLGTTLRPQTAEYKAELCRQLQPVLNDGFSKGDFRLVIDSEFSLSDVARAHQHMESGNHFGKIILKVGDNA